MLLCGSPTARAVDPPPPPPGLALTNGALLHKVFTNLSGVLVADLTNQSRFPNQPDLVGYVSQSETPVNSGDHYGAMLQGYLTPPASGDYIFYLSSDDQGALFLSTNSSPAGKQLVAWEPQWNGLRQWTNSANQSSRGTPPANVSPPIHLEAGGTYYVEAWLKEGSGDDSLSVAWQMPGGSPPETGSAPIPSAYLSAPWVTGPAVFCGPPQNQTVGELGRPSFSADLAALPPVTLQWLKNATPVADATNGVLTLSSAALVDDGAQLQLMASNAWGSVTSAPAMLTVLPDLTPPLVVSVTAGHIFNRVTILFSEEINPQDATNTVNFTVSGLEVAGAFLLSDGKTVVLDTSLQTTGAVYTVSLHGIRDRSAAANLVADNTQVGFTAPVLTRGFLTRECFTGIPGSSLANLLANPKFPLMPDVSDHVSRFESSYLAMDSYGLRLSGLLCPPVTGDYVFFLCSDDEGVLYLSTNEAPSNKVQIAREPLWNPLRQWHNAVNQSSRGTPPANVSAPIHLEAGQRYYVEALMKEGDGGDHLEVAWQKPGDPAPENFSDPIAGTYLATYVVAPGASLSIVSNPASVTIADHQNATFEVKARASAQDRFYQWQRNGEDIPGANGRTFTTPRVSLADSGARYRCLVSIPGASAVSQEATLTVVADADPPQLLAAEGGIGLDRVTLSFSEPLLSADVTNLSHYALSGGINVLSARLARNGTNLVLQTTPQAEGVEYTVTVSGLRDQSAAGNLIASNSPIAFYAWQNEEFVGPFSSWADVRRDFGAKGDGVTDDTDAIQQALDNLGTQGVEGFSDHPASLYFPAGTYRITRSVRLFARDSVSMVGEHPDTTTILWDGPVGADMLVADGTRRSKWTRLTWDGGTKARTGVFHTQTPGGFGVTDLEHSDEIFRDMETGVLSRPDPQFGLGDTISIMRCRFQRCSTAGMMTDHSMALEMLARHCTFEDCAIGAYARNGSIHVYDSLFLRSTQVDVIPAVAYITYTGIRRNTSIGSRRFIYGPPEGVPTGIAVAENTIIDTIEPDSILIQSRVPVTLLDNIFKSRPENAEGPVVVTQDNLLAVGNLFTVTNALWCNGRTVFLDNEVATEDSLDLTVPAMPQTLPNRHRTVFEVPVGADAATLQQIINQAAQLQGERPVVHLPQSLYRVTNTIIIPASTDLQLVGDGNCHVSELIWEGSGSGPILRLVGPVRATLRDLSVSQSTHPATAIVLEDVDQPGSRIFTDQLNYGSGRLCALMDRLDNTDVQMHRLQFYDVSEAGVRVIGGPRLGAGGSAPGRTSLYSSVCVAHPVRYTYEVLNGADLLLQEAWFEDTTPRCFKASGHGHFTVHGGRVNTANTNPDAPAVDIDGFDGEATFLGISFSRYYWWDPTYDGPVFRVREGNENAHVLVLGSETDYRGFVQNDSQDAEVGALLSQSRASLLPKPDQGDASPEFLRRMLARARDTAPRPLVPLPSGVTDARIYRVFIYVADVGLVLTRSNSPPSFATVSTQQVPEHSSLQVNCAASDPDLPFNLLTYSLLEAPTGATINPTNGLFSWTPGPFTVSNTYPVTVRVVDDGSPPLSATQQFFIAVIYTNHPPVVLPVVTNLFASKGFLFSLPMAVDAETNQVTWNLLQGPPGMTIHPESGVISWLPSLTMATGLYHVVVQAMDNWVPPRTGETSFDIQLLPASILAEIQLAATAYANSTIIASNTLGPEWFNWRGRISQMTPAGATNPSAVLMFDWDANIPCVLRSQQASRDHEVEVWKTRGPVFLRFAEDGSALRIDYELSGSGRLNVDIVFGLADLSGNPSSGYTIWTTNNLVAMIPGFHLPIADEDSFTFGVEGVEIYAKYQGVEFLRFPQYRQTKSGSAGVRLWGYDDGLRFIHVRFKAEKPLFSDLANGLFDMRDFGLRSVQVTGSMAAGSTQLSLSASPNPPFKPGDWIIVETGGEAGQGKRGTVGVGGIWPSLRYPNLSARDTDASQPVNTYCWTEDDGSVYQWDGTVWQDRARYMDGERAVTNYYLAKAVPKALRAQVAAVSLDGLVLTLSEAAQASVTNASVFFDNAPVLNMTFGEPEWMKSTMPMRFVLSVPAGNFAMGDPVWLLNRPGCGIRGTGTNTTRLFSPKGTPSASVFVFGSSNAFVESIHLQGNGLLEGFGLPFYHPRSGFWNGVTETSGDAAGRGSLQFYLCPEGRTRDVLITDPLSDAGAGLWVVSCDSFAVESVAIRKRTPTLGSGALVEFDWFNRGSVSNLVLDSDWLALGVKTWDADNMVWDDVRGRNVTLLGGGNLVIRNSQFLFDAMVQEGQDYWTPIDRAVIFLSGSQDPGQQFLLENVRIEQQGYMNSRQEVLWGIRGYSGYSLRVVGGSYTSPDYVAGTQGYAGRGLDSGTTTNWVEHFRVSGAPQDYNIRVGTGFITNCWADAIRPAPAVRIEKCWMDSNLAPIIGRLVEFPENHFTQSAVLGISGNPLEPGSTLITNGVVEVVAGGKSEVNLDAGRYAWTELAGDFDLVVRADNLLPVNPGRRAGIMIRRSLAPDAVEAAICAGDQGVRTFTRTVLGQNAWERGGAYIGELPNVWLRLRREGTRITTYQDPTHGWLWRTNASFDLPEVLASSNSVLVGFYASSDNNAAGQTTRAVFRDLRLANLSPVSVLPVSEGSTISFTVPGFDDNNPAQQLRWTLAPGSPDGAMIDPATGEFSWTPTEAQGPSTNLVTLRVSDDGIPSLSANNSFTVIVNETNSPPVLTVPTNQTINELAAWSDTASATDPDIPTNALSFEKVGVNPVGLTVSSNGGIAWTPSEAHGPGVHTVTVRVFDDGEPSESVTQSFTVVVREVNTAPQLAAQSDRTVNELATLNLTNLVTDADFPASQMTFELLAGPVGMVLNPATGVLTWTPTETQGPSTNWITVRVFDDGVGNLSATQSFGVVVREVNTAPQLAVPADQTIDELTTLSLSASATDEDVPGNKLTCELLAGPTGMTLATNTGVLAWTPMEAQGPSTNVVSLRVFDDGAPSLSATNSFTVVVREVNMAPTVTLTSPTNGAVFGRYAPVVLEAVAEDPDGNLQAVEFLDGTNRLEEVTSPPYRFVWTNGAAGPHFLRAWARDAEGLAVESLVAAITLLPPIAARVEPGTFSATQGFWLRVSGEPGSRCAVEASSDLVNWAGAGTNALNGEGTWWFFDPSATNCVQRFYRVRER
ncbi:MAG: hypothetical protein HZA90_09730 [Verrucomicrobia bacterium]|nr:hypothetical protein [Verrucomicrobiota bacterium]